MKKILKDWWKSLWPFRWIIPMLFIVLMGSLIWMGSQLPSNPTGINLFENPYIWYGGNLVFWPLLDIFFGLGREGPLFKIIKKDGCESDIHMYDFSGKCFLCNKQEN